MVAGTSGGLVLFQPVPDRIPPEAAADAPLEDLVAAAPWAGLIDAAAEKDAGVARGPHPGKGCNHGHARPAALNLIYHTSISIRNVRWDW